MNNEEIIEKVKQEMKCEFNDKTILAIQKALSLQRQENKDLVLDIVCAKMRMDFNLRLESLQEKIKMELCLDNNEECLINLCETQKRSKDKKICNNCEKINKIFQKEANNSQQYKDNISINKSFAKKNVSADTEPEVSYARIGVKPVTRVRMDGSLNSKYKTYTDPRFEEEGEWK